jgi:hypothetical protein
MLAAAFHRTAILTSSAACVDRILADDMNTPDSAQAHEGDESRGAVRLLLDLSSWF